MGWSALPNAGGLYDQHPQLLEEFTVIFARRAVYEKNQQAIKDAKTGNKR